MTGIQINAAVHEQKLKDHAEDTNRLGGKLQKHIDGHWAFVGTLSAAAAGVGALVKALWAGSGSKG
jgi:hypothetical protein